LTPSRRGCRVSLGNPAAVARLIRLMRLQANAFPSIPGGFFSDDTGAFSPGGRPDDLQPAFFQE